MQTSNLLIFITLLFSQTIKFINFTKQKKQKKMERICIEYRENDHRKLVALAGQAVKIVAPFVDEVQKINGLEFTDQLLRDVLFSTDGALVAEAMADKISKQLQQAGITSQGILDAAINADRQTFYDRFGKFKLEIIPVKDGLHGLQMSDGKVIVNPAFEAETKDQFCRFITTTAAKDLHDKHTAAAEALTVFLQALPLAHRGNMLQLFMIDPQADTVTPIEKIDYDFITSFNISH